MSKTSETSQLSSLQTRHDQASAELEIYKLLVDSVEDYAIFLLDREGYIRTWNKGAAKFKGYKAEEIIGKHFSVFYTQEDIDARKPPRELEIATRIGRIEDEDWRVRKDGSRFWANVVITALRDTDGKLVGFAKVTRDLTERKQQEDSLREANSLLRRQQRELELLNNSKDEFISLASHQLRTPATAIKQLLGLLLEGMLGDLPPEQMPLIQKAYDSNERQIGIVNSLLRVAQIDAGKIVLHKTITDIVKLLEDIIDEQRDTIQSRRQAVVFQPHKTQALLLVDPQHLRMALENIVDNASKYTGKDGRITVATHLALGELKISIQDSGVGIAAADLPNLFEKFNRIPNKLSQKVPGSGLGLYWVQKVIDMHDGRIEVESQPDEGTTFHIYLPMEAADA